MIVHIVWKIREGHGRSNAREQGIEVTETVREGSHQFRRGWFQEGVLAGKASNKTPWNESLYE